MLMADPTALFSFLNSAIKVAEYAVKIYSAESENGVFVRIIQTVRFDLAETERLLCAPSVKRKLISIPGKLNWIKGVVLHTKGSLDEIGKWVDRVRADKEGNGSVSWENKVRWAFNDQEKVVNRRMGLQTSHQALSTVLSYLTGLEDVETTEDVLPPTYGNATFFDDVISPRQRKQMLRNSEKTPDMGQRGNFDEVQSHPKQSLKSVLVTSPPVASESKESGEKIRTPDIASHFQTSQFSSSSAWPLMAVDVRTTTSVPTSRPVPYISESPEWPPKTVERLQILTPSSEIESTASRQLLPPDVRPSSTSLPTTATSLAVQMASLTPRPASRCDEQIKLSSQPCKDTNGYISCAYLGIIPVQQSGPTFSEGISYNTSPQTLSTRLSATNYGGPINPFEFVPELDSQTDPIGEQGVQMGKNPFPYPIAAELFVDNHDTIPLPSPHFHPKTVRAPMSHVEGIVELIGDISVLSTEDRGSQAEMSTSRPPAQPWPMAPYHQQPLESLSRQHMLTPRSEMLGDTINNHLTRTTTPTRTPSDHYYTANEGLHILPKFDSSVHTSNYEEVTSHPVHRPPQVYEEYTPYEPQWSSNQPLPIWESQVPSQYQAYPGSAASNILHKTALSPVSTIAPSPVPFHNQIQALPPQIQPAVSLASSAQVPNVEEQEHPLSRSLTVAEARRRNQKSMLEFMSRGSYS